MCQLTFVNTNNKDFNVTFLVNQYLINTINTHRDGWGFFNEESGVFKTSLHPWQTSNLGSAVGGRIRNSYPIIGHVRLASICHDKKIVCQENAHPFESKDFILAHNGTFDGEVIDDLRFLEKIDSEVFLTVLQEFYDKFPKRKIHKLIKDVYDKYFSGKFALLIYFKPTKRFYVARGKTADLYKIDIFEGESEKKNKKIGFILNTEKIDLERGFRFTSKILQIDKKETDFFCGEPEELDENTIYIVNSTYLREVGKIIETKKAYGVWENNAHTGTMIPHDRNRHTVTPLASKEVDFLLKLSDEYKLSAEEMDTLFLEITGYAMICAERDQFKTFQDVLEPILENFTAHKGSLWLKLGTSAGGSMFAYHAYELQFPYFLNSASRLNELWIEVKNENQKLLKESGKKNA